jgi:hypothetical protein
MREKEYGIWQAHSWAGMAQLVEHLACGLHQPACSAASTWWSSAPTGRACTPPCWPRRRWARSRSAVPGRRGRRMRLPDQQRRRALRLVEDQEQVDKLLEIRGQCPQLDADHLRRPARPAQLCRARPAVAGCAAGRARFCRRSSPDFFRAEVGRPSPTTWPRCSSPRAPRATPRAWCTPTHPAGPRQGRRRLRQAHLRRGSAGLPAAGLGRPEHLQLCAVAGLRLCGELPRARAR